MKTKLDTVKKTDLDVISSSPPPPPQTICQVLGLKSLISLVTFLFLSAFAYAQNDEADHFVLKVTTTAGTNANDKSFTFYTQDTNYDIDWNNDQTFEDLGVAGNQPHTFPTAGVHTIRFRNLNDIYINNQADTAKYTSIEQWGTSVWNVAMDSAFQGASNLTMNATAGTPDMSLVTNMAYMFNGATSFNGDISGWNTASVTSMSRMFWVATSFNQNVGNWNTAQVTDMRSLFSRASTFNQDIGRWNTENVTDMSYMFYSNGAHAFNQEIGNWNTENVIDMSYMFFRASNFNHDIGSWNTGNVIDMQRMFEGASSFDRDIGSWNVEKVTTMESMFYSASAFNQDIGNWNVENVEIMTTMFNGATAFNQDIGNWNVKNVTTMQGMFFTARAFNQDIGNWNVENVTTMQNVFFSASSFDRDIGRWNTASVTTMQSMFQGASAFNQDIGNWNVENVTTMEGMFYEASAFNQDIGNWNIENVTNLSFMFFSDFTHAFNQDIGNWNVENVTTMKAMFRRARNFNQDIGRWNTALVTSMAFMFRDAPAFNGDISGWNIEKVTSISWMFDGATTFNQDISGWNTAQVTIMQGAFNGATTFNQDISGWNIEKVTTISWMFENATTFNQDISGWNTATVTGMKKTFSEATAFDLNIGGWNVEAVLLMDSMFYGVTLSIANYDSLLVGWNRQNLRLGEFRFHGGNSLYMSAEAQTARANMINSDRWTITDGGLRTMNQAPTNIILSSTRIAENAGADAVVGILSNTDTGGTYTYTLVTGDGDADNGSFNILGTNLRLTSSADYETKGSYSIRINVNDRTNDFSKSFIITVTDVANEHAPVFTSGTAVSVAEGMTEVTTVTATDGDGDEVTFTLSGGADAGLLSITPVGVLTFNTAPDFQNPADTGEDNIYEVIVTATDGHPSPMTATQALTITVTDMANEHAPVFTNGATATVSYYVGNPSTAVTTVTATDADAGQIVTFTLTGGADVALFSITSTGELTFKTVPDYETPTDTGMDNMYEVIITATDNGAPAMTAMQALTITVTNEDGATGLEAFTGIAVYPNPAGAVLHISGVAGNARYSLSGIDGKVLKRGKLQAGKAGHSVAIPSLNRGIYLLQLTTGKGSVTRKIVKE